MQERSKERKTKAQADKISCFQAEYPTNTLFISISNEWSPVILVEIIDYMIKGSSILPIIRDVRTQEEFISFTKLITYTEPLLSIIKPLSPFERYSLVTGTDITKKTLIIDKPGIDNEPALEVFINLANQWISSKEKTINNK